MNPRQGGSMGDELTNAALIALIGAFGLALALRGAGSVAAFLSGTFSWWLLVVRPNRLRFLPAVTAGALAAVFGHFLCWYLLLVGAFFWHLATGQGHSLGSAPVNPLQAVPAAGIYGAFSLFLLGWITIPTGALLGGVLAAVQRRNNDASHSAL